MDEGNGSLKWVAELRYDILISRSKLMMSYGSINFFQHQLLFFGGQQKKTITEKVEEEEDEYQVVSDLLPYDTIFEILSFLSMKDQLSVAATSKSWTVSIAARSDRLWGQRYDDERKKSTSGELPSYQMKKVIPTDYVPTVFDNYNATVNVDGKDIGLCLWDTAGEEDYDELRPLSYAYADVFAVCCSCANPVSLMSARRKWFPEIRRHEPEVPIALCIPKTDLRGNKDVIEELADSNQVVVTREEGIKVCKELKACAYFETSARTGKGVKEFFDGMIRVSLSGLRDKERLGGDDKCGVM